MRCFECLINPGHFLLQVNLRNLLFQKLRKNDDPAALLLLILGSVLDFDVNKQMNDALYICIGDVYLSTRCHIDVLRDLEIHSYQYCVVFICRRKLFYYTLLLCTSLRTQSQQSRNRECLHILDRYTYKVQVLM